MDPNRCRYCGTKLDENGECPQVVRLRAITPPDGYPDASDIRLEADDARDAMQGAMNEK